MSAKSTYTSEIGKAVATAYEEIGVLQYACEFVGVNPRTAYNWLERGDQGIQPYDEFKGLIGMARARLAKGLIEKARRDKGGPAFLLERMFPSQFGPKTRNTQEAMQTLLDGILPRLTESAAREVVDALAAIERERGSGDVGMAHGQAAGDRAEVIEVVGESVEPRRLEPGPE